MTTGERIKQRREELGMSADRLAEILGKNRATIYRYENGAIENLPSVALKPIAIALRTTPAYLMGYEDGFDDSADVVADIIKDANVLEHIRSLLELSEKQRQTIFDMIDFFKKEKGR